jgi:hypothetical protein
MKPGPFIAPIHCESRPDGSAAGYIYILTYRLGAPSLEEREPAGAEGLAASKSRPIAFNPCVMSVRLASCRSVVALALAAAGTAGALADDDEFELPPIEYSMSQPENVVSKLQKRLDGGEAILSFDKRLGHLTSLLDALKAPVDSQVLVFSKTSMQRSHISPRTPRAIYFNDDVYVGYCQGGEVIEVAAADPKLGTVFYTASQHPETLPILTRQTKSCLQCHGMSQVQNIPGLVARSLYVDASGGPLLSEGSRYVDQTTPLKDRWGGWYVTGMHGSQTHLGNLVLRKTGHQPYDNATGMNVTDLADRIRVQDYLSPHSDIVALMVLEHQLLMHNLITKANFEARRALYYQADLNRALGEPVDTRLESTTRRIVHVGEKLVEGLLFANEAPITDGIRGTSTFAENFAKRGPCDERGRSLRDFDLHTRMFKYPCSYLIYSDAFGSSPDAMKSYVLWRLKQVLGGEDSSGNFTHLTAQERIAILEILKATKPDLWNAMQRSTGEEFKAASRD